MDQAGEWALEKAVLEDNLKIEQRETDRLRSLLLAILSKYQRALLTEDHFPLFAFLASIDTYFLVDRRLPPAGMDQ